MRKISFNIFPFYHQYDRMDCGPTSLKMVAEYYGNKYSLNSLRNICHISKAGISMQGLKVGAEKIGFNTMVVKVPFTNDSGQSLQQIPLPTIAFWNQNHFIVIYKMTSKFVYVADPANGKIKLPFEQFKKSWFVEKSEEGIVLLLVPGNEFSNKFDIEDNEPESNATAFLSTYFQPYKKFLAVILATLLMGSFLLLLFPFLTKSIVDVGIHQKDIKFIYLILIAQLILYFSQTSLNFVQRWLVLHISSRINILLSSNFLKKITRLPLSFFDNKQFGDLFQRINDHRKIESFFTASTLTVLFSLFNIIVFGIVLCFYNPLIFGIFLTGSTFYFIWIIYFIRKRKLIDYQLFQEYTFNTDMMYELIQGMQEIKLQNSEQKRTEKWTESQRRLFKININSTSLSQYQDGGAFFINQLKDILITIIAATAVIRGNMSLGMLIATQYIIGQLNSPLQQIVAFIRSGYEANLSLKRIVEIHDKQEEDQGKLLTPIKAVDLHQDIIISNLSFKYNELNDYVLKDVNLSIPKGKVTAIVGASGSGKTTLVKLLLGFYQPTDGSIYVGTTNLAKISSPNWRDQCGAVMQDGYIFSDSIADNIAESDKIVDFDKLKEAVEIANISDYIDSLALKHNTQIGSQGNGISQGQRQRMLIARAVYKNPNYLFFDEATNALDAKNEKIIVGNLERFYKSKTVIIVAHRLSTVKNADKIIVLENGTVVEQGFHKELVEAKGGYYDLVSNQLELGS